jgi:hypothetical protein
MGSTVRGVEFVELLHVGEDAAEVGGVLVDFLLAEGEVGEAGDVADVFFGEFQAVFLSRRSCSRSLRAREFR